MPYMERLGLKRHIHDLNNRWGEGGMDMCGCALLGKNVCYIEENRYNGGSPLSANVA